MCHLLWWIGQGGNFYSLFGPKNTNWLEDVKILLPVKIRWIPFSGFIGEVNQRTGRLSCFSDQPEKCKPGRGCLDLASCPVLLNSIQRFQRKSWKCLSKHRPGQPFCFSDPPEKHILGRGRWDLASYQVSSNSFHSFRGEVENISANQRPGRPFCFSRFALKTHT